LNTQRTAVNADAALLAPLVKRMLQQERDASAFKKKHATAKVAPPGAVVAAKKVAVGGGAAAARQIAAAVEAASAAATEAAMAAVGAPPAVAAPKAGKGDPVRSKKRKTQPLKDNMDIASAAAFPETPMKVLKRRRNDSMGGSTVSSGASE
jgi:hypothetical protein